MTTGGTELLVVLAIAVVLFGPKKLPELARTIGLAMGEYHKATREFENEMKKASTTVDKEITGATSPELTKTPPPKAINTKSSSQSTAIGKSTISGTPPKASKSVRNIASNLGIDTNNKTDSELLQEISSKTKKKESSEG